MVTAQRLVDEFAGKSMSNSKIRDEDGKLLVVYHGSYEHFNKFDMSKSRTNMDIQGSFFSPWEIDAKGYGENVRRFYLNITNPASEAMGYKALHRFQGQNNAGLKAREYLINLGYDGVNNSNEEYIAFYPEQIKSADPVTYDDNGNVIPLSERFNEDKEDIRYQTRSSYQNIDLSTLDDEELKVYNNRGWANDLFTKEDRILLNEKFSMLNSDTHQQKDNVLGDGSRLV